VRPFHKIEWIKNENRKRNVESLMRKEQE